MGIERRSKRSPGPNWLSHEKCVHLDSIDCQVYVTHLPSGCMSRCLSNCVEHSVRKVRHNPRITAVNQLGCAWGGTRAFSLTFRVWTAFGEYIRLRMKELHCFPLFMLVTDSFISWKGFVLYWKVIKWNRCK